MCRKFGLVVMNTVKVGSPVDICTCNLIHLLSCTCLSIHVSSC